MAKRRLICRDLVLKEEQIWAIYSLLEAKDVAACLPTGFGKIIIYQLFSSAKRQQTQKDVIVVLVASPLRSITKDQIEEMNQLGISVVALTMILPYSSQ